jgi:hypothetical protein
MDYWNPRPVSVSMNDPVISLDRKYQHRPDLLSYDLYGTVDLWWVFMSANPDVIKDPIWDFREGMVLIIPAANNILGGS